MKKYKVRYTANVLMTVEIEAKNEELAKQFVERGEHEKLAREYAKQSGLKNPEVFKWDEFGYFN